MTHAIVTTMPETSAERLYRPNDALSLTKGVLYRPPRDNFFSNLLAHSDDQLGAAKRIFAILLLVALFWCFVAGAIMGHNAMTPGR